MIIFLLLSAILPACVSDGLSAEDPTTCFYDAHNRGNMVGTPFIAHMGEVILIGS